MTGDFVETHAGYIRGEPTMIFDTGEAKLIRYIFELKEKHPDDVVIETINYNFEDNTKIESIVAEIPRSWFKKPSPPKKMNLTEEQKQERRERMKNIRANKSIEKSE